MSWERRIQVLVESINMIEDIDEIIPSDPKIIQIKETVYTELDEVLNYFEDKIYGKFLLSLYAIKYPPLDITNKFIDKFIKKRDIVRLINVIDENEDLMKLCLERYKQNPSVNFMSELNEIENKYSEWDIGRNREYIEIIRKIKQELLG